MTMMEEMQRYRVLIVDDQEMPRQLFETFLRTSERFVPVASIRSAEDALLYADNGDLDLILMDVCTEGRMSGLEAAKQIKRQHPRIRIIIVTSMPEYSYLKRAREAGVDSFWYKEAAQTPLLELMERTMQGESLYPDRTPEVKLGLSTSEEFSERELEILRELTSGDTNNEIAARLCMSPYTVRDYVQTLLEKTGFRSRTELAVKARESGLVIREEQEE